MEERKRKFTAAEKAEKRRRRAKYMTILVGGKQKRIRRPPTVGIGQTKALSRRKPRWDGVREEASGRSAGWGARVRGEWESED
jgi:hypothetical protein